MGAFDFIEATSNAPFLMARTADSMLPWPEIDHDLRINLPLAQPLQGGQAVEPGQPDVEHDDVEGRAVGLLEALFAGTGGVDVEALVLEDAAD